MASPERSASPCTPMARRWLRMTGRGMLVGGGRLESLDDRVALRGGRVARPGTIGRQSDPTTD